jgi:hypothetical protein
MHYLLYVNNKLNIEILWRRQATRRARQALKISLQNILPIRRKVSMIQISLALDRNVRQMKRSK